MPLRPARRLLGALALLAGTPAMAAVYTVGGGVDCSHATVQAAIATAAGNPAGPHTLRLTSGTVPNFAGATISNPQADITVVGGHASCSAATPTPGQTTILDANNGNRHFTFTSTAVTRRLRLRNLVLDRGSADIGGAIRADGQVDLILEFEAEVRRSSAGRGGGIAIGVTPGGSAFLFLDGGAQIRQNTATDAAAGGGGIYAGASGRVFISHASITQNNAAGHGGGIHLAGPGTGGLSITPTPSGPGFAGGLADISNNRAHFGQPVADSSTLGRGGGVYADRREVRVDPPPGGDNRHGLQMVGNRALNGGGLAVANSAGAGDPEILVTLSGTLFGLNQASNSGGAVFGTGRVLFGIGHAADAPCPAFWLFGFTYGCSAFVGNHAGAADGIAAVVRPGVGAIYAAGASGESRLTINRTEFRGNTSDGSIAALFAFSDNLGARVLVERSVFTGNEARAAGSFSGGGGVRALNYFGGSVEVPFRYNTVLDNPVQQLFASDRINLQGSVLWSPGSAANFAYAPQAVVHNDCLLASAGDHLPGAGDPTRVFSVDPRIDATSWRPRSGSAAIDACDELGYAPDEDLFRRPPFADLPGVPDRFGAASGRHDLGAYEVGDVLHYGGFGDRQPATVGPYRP